MRISAIPEPKPGYWVIRGWSKEARPNIISIIDVVATDHIVDGKVPIGGIAYEGAVPIAAVQIQVDDGEWQEATVLRPPLSPLTWVQWRYDWRAQPGRHTFTVRAIDANGEVQIGIPSDPHPSGATGYHTVVARI